MLVTILYTILQSNSIGSLHMTSSKLKNGNQILDDIDEAFLDEFGNESQSRNRKQEFFEMTSYLK